MSQDAVEETRPDLILNEKENHMTAKDLDVIPHTITEGLPIEFLRHYRAGGYDMGSISIDQAGLPVKNMAPKHQLD